MSRPTVELNLVALVRLLRDYGHECANELGLATVAEVVELVDSSAPLDEIIKQQESLQQRGKLRSLVGARDFARAFMAEHKDEQDDAD